MVIEIQSTLFLDEKNLVDLSYLLTIFSENRRYNYFCEIDKIRETEVFKNLIPIHRELIEENFNSIVNQSSKIDYVVSVETSNDSFNVQEAKLFFNQPFILILENSNNDGYFINALIKCFRKRSKKIALHKENRWLQYGMGGGCNNIVNFITALIKSYEGLELPKASNNYLKCMVLIDSDKEFETDNTKPDRVKLFTFLKENGIRYHEFKKREMENYLPDEVLESIPEIDEYIQYYLQLSPIQKDYFDIENGFNNKKLSQLPMEVQDLYSDLDETTIGVLRKGMTISNFKGSLFKAEFPKLFEHEKVTKESLLSRTIHQGNEQSELQTVLDKISELL
ncbi:MAG: hypothetical protein IPO63_13425 [Bacteroidetes bacterium]|nr:hypothetical protein [Bacteroidota bacterium]